MEKSSIFKIVNGLTSALLIAPVISTATMAMAQEAGNGVDEVTTRTIYHNDFTTDPNEDPAIQDAGSTLTHTTELDFEGNENNSGVWVTERGDDWSGIDVRFEALGLEEDQKYSISVLGYLDSEEDIPEDAQLTLQHPDTYGWIDGTSDLVPSESFVLEGEYTHTDNPQDVAFRIQSNNEGKDVEFAIADILITTEEISETDPGEEDNDESEEESELDILYHATFEEDDEGTVGAGADVQHEEGVMRIADRSANWHGLDVPFSVSGMEYGFTYEVTIRGFVDENTEIPEEAQAWLQVPEEDYPLLSQVDFVAGEEFVLTDTFTVSNEAYTQLRIQSNDAGATVDFDVTEVLIEWDPNQTPIQEEEPDPDAPPAEEFTFIDFENGEFNGFEGRNGEEDLVITDEANHTEDGEYSLHISNRQESWHGPSLEVTPYINRGETYVVSAWVKVDTESDQTVTLSTQVGEGSAAAYNTIGSATLSADDGWVEISGEYRYTASGFTSIYVESNNVTLDFYVDDVNFQQIESDPIEVDLELPSLDEVYAEYFRIGNAVSLPDLEGERLDLLKHHHNLVTAENAMKPGEIYDGREFDFSGSDTLAQRVDDAGLDLHGHVLVWHSQSPDWHHTDSDGNTLPEEEALENMHNHIREAMENFGNIGSWDVVNEALDAPGGDWGNPEEWENNIRNTGWHRAIGDDYIYQAFKYARQVADENGWHDMVLYYNDYNDHVQPKAQTMYYMIKDINEKWTAETGDTRKLISGVGMQGHYSININPDTVKESIERFEQLGIEIGITELDVTTNTENQYVEDEWIRQGQIYARLFQIFKEHSDSIDRVTFWGLNDANSWRSERYPLLFDGSLRAKPAYHAVVDPDAFLEEYPIGGAIANESYAVYGTPEMDGEIDEVWSEAPVLNMNQMQQAHEILADGTGRVLWDEQNLYVLFQVSDSILDISAEQAHEQDSVEVFVNETGETTTSYTDGVGQYRVNYENESSFNPSSYSEGFESATVVSDSGYTVEMAIPWKDITPEAWRTIGFDIQINDARNGERHGVAAWNDDTGMGWSDPSVFGRLTLATTIEELILLLEERISNLEEAMDENEENLAELTSQLAELQNLLSVLQDDLGEANDTISDLEDRIRELEERLAELEAGDDEEPTDPEGEDVIEIEEDTPTPVQPGQTIVLPDGETSIETPADLPEGTEVIIEYLNETDLPELSVEGDYTLVVAGEIVRVTMVYPEGEEDFTGNFELTLGIDEDFVGEEVFIYYYNEDAELWEQQVAEIEGDTITTTVTHFSIYGVFAQVEEDGTPVPEYILELIRQLEERLANLEEAVNENEETIEELTSQLTELRNLLAILRDELGETNETVTDLEERVRELEGRVAELEASDEEEPSNDDGDETEDDSSSDEENGVTDEDEDTDETLPKTATATWTVGLIGLMGLVTGSGIHFIRKRK